MEIERSGNMAISRLIVRDVVVCFRRAHFAIPLSFRKSFKILHAAHCDFQQPINYIYAWQWMTVDQYEARYYGTIIHTRGRQRFCLYRIPTHAGMHMLFLLEV